MKHRTLKPREYRDFLGKRTVPYLVRRAEEAGLLRPNATVEQNIRGLALGLERYFESDPRVVVRSGVPIRLGTEETHPALFAVTSLPWTGAEVSRSEPYVVGDDRPVPEFVLECFESKPTPEALADRADFHLRTLGVEEYFAYFVGAPDYECIEAFHIKDGEQRRIGAWTKQWHSSVLRLDFGLRDGRLCLFDARAAVLVPTPFDAVARRMAEDGER